ncbi:MAG TPA: ATP-binding protein [Rubrivivax sp.]|nr:ATP-binding protein [Rubrivivax sp.]
MRLSFRARLFFQAATVVAVVLAVVMSLGWSRVLSFETGRLDERLCMEARRLAGPMPANENIGRLSADVALKLRLEAQSQLLLRSTSPEGALRLESDGWGGAWDVDLPPSAASPEPGEPPSGRRPGPRYRCWQGPVAIKGVQWHVARVQSETGTGWVAADPVAITAEMKSVLLDALSIVVPLALTLTAVGAWLLSSLSMRPLNRLRNAMRRVTPQALDQRLADKGEDQEFRDLIQSYNTMMDRLEVSFRQASRFSADAAHELKTPLTILRGQLEQAVRHSEKRAIQDDLTQMLDEVGRLSGITRKLLLLSQSDAGKLPLHREPVDLSALLQDLMTDAQMLLEQQRLDSRIEPGLTLQADALLIRQVFNNLISNAVRHGLPQGWIRVEAKAREGGVVVVVANACHAMLAEQRAHLFERFYRADPAHSRVVDGTGLGLSLAREVARAHGGELDLEPSGDEEIHMRLWLPGR